MNDLYSFLITVVNGKLSLATICMASINCFPPVKIILFFPSNSMDKVKHSVPSLLVDGDILKSNTAICLSSTSSIGMLLPTKFFEVGLIPNSWKLFIYKAFKEVAAIRMRCPPIVRAE